jgi:hypothetical protein
LVSNKNMLSISIFNNVMRFEIYTRSVHFTLVHCRVSSAVYGTTLTLA